MPLIAEIEEPASAGPVLDAWFELLDSIQRQLRELAAHPARSVVLLPFAQLIPLAARLWAQRFPDGFAPRFDTTRSWAARAGWFVPGPSDLSFDHGRDRLTAASLLEGAGLGRRQRDLTGPLLEQASQLARLAASVPAALRPAWAEHARAALPPAGDGPLAVEAALGRIALAWAGLSDYATDVLFEPRVGAALDALVIVEGLQPDPLTATLAEHYFEQAVALAFPNAQARAAPALHACLDGEDEAERAAACVLQHLATGCTPVGLVATDRLLTRRISALLTARGVRLRDETGWKLSTTQAAAQLLAALHACARAPSSDAVLDWLKLMPASGTAAAAVRQLESRLRRHGVRDWSSAVARWPDDALVQRVEALRAPLQGTRRLPDWLAATVALLHQSGAWPALAADPAGAALIDALGLSDAAQAELGDWPAAQRRLSLAAFTRWVSDTLEAASFKPPHAPGAPVIVLPLSQLLGRPLAALVLPGADAQRLPAAPEPAGPWTEAQRAALGLPTLVLEQAAQQAAWQMALASPQVDLLWRSSDDHGEPLLPSPRVQQLQLAALGQPGQDARSVRVLPCTPVARPAPSGASLPAQPLSASGYEMLRACPYRFFALRQLGLQEDAELDVDVSKRDFGDWVHAVLLGFHSALQHDPGADRRRLIDAAAAEATRQAALAEGEFLPFAVAWPALRDGYLAWLAGYQAERGAAFEQGELRLQRQLDEVTLHGTLDRLDRLPDGAALVIDYKTERRLRTQARLKAGSEDTQLAFYALLQGADVPQAAYLNLGEGAEVSWHAPADLDLRAAQLHAGIVDDLQRIRAGQPLRALGEGSVCDWCNARGLCRRDFWTT